MARVPLVAALIGIVLSRMKETAMAMSTLALLVIAHGVYANWVGMTRGAEGVYALPQNTNLWVAFGFACLAVIVGAHVPRFAVGLRLQASREDPLSAEATGVSVVKSRYIAWVASAALAALSGSVWAQFNLAFDPSQFYYTQVFAVLSMLVIGGMATVSGAIVGAGVVTVCSQILYDVEGGQLLRDGGAADQRPATDDPRRHHAADPHLSPQRDPQLVGARRLAAARAGSASSRAARHAGQSGRLGAEKEGGAEMALAPDVTATYRDRRRRGRHALMEAVGVVKHFRGVHALDGVSL